MSSPEPRCRTCAQGSAGPCVAPAQQRGRAAPAGGRPACSHRPSRRARRPAKQFLAQRTARSPLRRAPSGAPGAGARLLGQSVQEGGQQHEGHLLGADVRQPPALPHRQRRRARIVAQAWRAAQAASRGRARAAPARPYAHRWLDQRLSLVPWGRAQVRTDAGDLTCSSPMTLPDSAGQQAVEAAAESCGGSALQARRRSRRRRGLAAAGGAPRTAGQARREARAQRGERVQRVQRAGGAVGRPGRCAAIQRAPGRQVALQRLARRARASSLG